LFSTSGRDAAALWATALDALAGRVAPRTRSTIAASTAALELSATALRVAARTSELSGWLGSGSVSLLRRTVQRLTDGAQSLALAPVRATAPLGRDPLLDFASFIVSPANSAARDRVRAAASGRDRGPSFLLLEGPHGAGKTHLLRSAATALADRLAQPVLALSAEQVVLELVDALWRDDLASFRARLVGASALILDGLEALEGREATQVELVPAISGALERGATVILSSGRFLLRGAQILPELARLLERAEIVELEAPGWETRVAIALDRIQAWGLRATPEVASYIAVQLRSDLERLDAVLTLLIGESCASGGLEDLTLVEQILQGTSLASERPSAEHVIQLVARHFGIRLRDLRSSGRAPRFSAPRQIAMYLLRRHCGLSYPEVGRVFRRHHTTALHSDRLVQRRLQTDPVLRSAVLVLEKELRSRPERGR
jgi:chromosomal replication initiator protein